MPASSRPVAGRVSSPVKLRYVVGAALLGALAVLLAGSYAGGWSWTGFRANGTLWDWLHLLLLPLVVATLPLWYSAFQTRRRWWLWALVVLLVAFTVVAVGGYEFSWTWTGFKGNTLWDWVALLLVPAMVPLAVFWLTHRSQEDGAETRDRDAD